MEQQSEAMQQPALAASSDADSGCALDEYTWVPPGLTTQQVSVCLHVHLCDKIMHNTCRVHIVAQRANRLARWATI